VGCAHKQVVEKSSGPATVSDSSGNANVTVDLNGSVVIKSGVLIVPLRVTNSGGRFAQVLYDRCEIEDTAGNRRRRHMGSGSTSLSISPGETKSFKLIFGETTNPVMGDTFRIYSWIQLTDGSGLIDNLPPLVIGQGTFASAPKPFRKGTAPANDLPPPTESPPPSATSTPTSTQTPAGQMRECPHCSEMRPATGDCPHCGLP
jgi:hypothetical protein